MNTPKKKEENSAHSFTEGSDHQIKIPANGQREDSPAETQANLIEDIISMVKLNSEEEAEALIENQFIIQRKK